MAEVGLSAAEIEAVFAHCFQVSHRTVLLGGATEPEYLPGEPLNQLWYRQDFAASALHEVAHWCIAGANRRLLRDFGYWYEPDGRDVDQQAAFLRAEARNQALEQVFAQAAGRQFVPSFDNLSGTSRDQGQFVQAIGEHRYRLDTEGLPTRAAQFALALAAVFGTR